MSDSNELKTQEAQVLADAPGKKILIVASVLFLVFSGLALLAFYILISVRMYAPAAVALALAQLLPVFAAQVFAGVFGCMNCNKTEKAGQLLVVGIVALLVAVGHTFAGAAFSLIGVPNLVFSALYIYGAARNLAAWKSELKARDAHTRRSAPGRNILLVTGAVLVVFGGYFLLPLLRIPHYFWFNFSFTLASGAILAALQVVVGITGMINWNDIEKARMLRVWGIVLLAAVFLDFAWRAFVGFGWNLSLNHLLVLRLILPIGFLYGAQKNLGAWKEKSK